MNLPYHLILGSKSPRRKELLHSLGLVFSEETYPVEETFDKQLASEDVAEFLAQKKSLGFRPLRNNELLLTADTTVIKGEKILGKPSNRAEAMEMLAELSGRKHQVISGVYLRTINKTVSFHVKTDVIFEELEEQEIQHYLDDYKPYDKAGAYGIQEWIGMIGIKSIEGDYYNVVGLPLNKLYQTLKREFQV